MKALPALKAGTFAAGISTSAPVLGFLPLRAALWRVSKVPKPTTETLSPFLSASVIVPRSASRASPASFFVRLAF